MKNHLSFVNHIDGLQINTAIFLSDRASSHNRKRLQSGIEGNSFALPQQLFTPHTWTYTFSAKERDPETGLSYFGSRYYSSDLSIWLSVDPMSDKYASLSPYTYCANNPVKLVDPDGEEVDDNLDKWKYNKTTGELSWYSNTGGSCHQIIVETENTLLGERASRTIEFDGAIGRMFKFSVFGEMADGLIKGICDIKNGIETFGAGLTIGVATEGAGTAAAASICFFGAGQASNGLKEVAEAFAKKLADPYGEQDLVKDILKTTVNTGSKAISNNIKTAIGMFKYALKNASVSFGWSAIQYYKVSHPTNKGVPKDAVIKYH
jgi:RHS repeat-associated protein